MAPHKVRREKLSLLTDLPNVGPAMAADLRLLGYLNPEEIRTADPIDMYWRLCTLTGQQHDPCVIDVFMSITHFLQGEAPQVWWAYTAKRKRIMETTHQEENPLP